MLIVLVFLSYIFIDILTLPGKELVSGRIGNCQAEHIVKLYSIDRKSPDKIRSLV